MKPEKINAFMYALVKLASRNSLMDFLESWEISEEEYEDIEKWFNEQGVSFWGNS